MEYFDKIKEVVIKCIKRSYPDCQVTFIKVDVYKLNVHLFQASKSEQLRCCEIIDDILKLCHIKTYINVTVNCRSRLLIKLDSITEELSAMRAMRNEINNLVIPTYNIDPYEIPTPMLMINSTYGGYVQVCNTDPICL
jgi:hypothetical protein